jgi:hypothetical protein
MDINHTPAEIITISPNTNTTPFTLETLQNPNVYRPQAFSDTNRYGWDYQFWMDSASRVPASKRAEYIHKLEKANKIYLMGQEISKDGDFAGYHIMAEGACKAYAYYQYYVYRNPNYLVPIEAGLYRNGSYPIDIRTFIEDPEYLGDMGIVVWPAIMTKLQEMNRYPYTTDVGVNEVLMGGAVGIGKTFQAVVSCLYKLYLLSCYDDINAALFPSRSSQKPLSLILSSVNLSQMMSDTFESVLGYFDACPYFKKYAKRNMRKSNEIEFTSMDVNVSPTLAKRSKIVAYDVFWAFLDEVNQMEIIDTSVKSKGDDGGASYYNQAEELVSECLSRYESRFAMRQDKPYPKIGAVFQASSSNYIGDFLDKKFEQQKHNPSPRVVVSNFKLWEARPKELYCGDTFKFLVGTSQVEGRVLDTSAVEGIDYPVGAEIEDIPVEHYDIFFKDPNKGQREFMGRPTSTSDKLFENQTVLLKGINQYNTHIKKNNDIKRWLMENRLGLDDLKYSPKTVSQMCDDLEIEESFVASTDMHTGYILKENVILSRDGMPMVHANNLPLDRDKPRYIHLDMSSTGDATGIACIKVVDLKKNLQGESIPVYMTEFACSIKPSRETPITNTAVRQFVQDLKTVYGFNIKKVTYDGVASAETMDLLKANHISTEYLSTDRDMDAYEFLKDTLIEGNLYLSNNPILSKELFALVREKNGQHVKINHPSGSGNSKDIADAVAGALYSASKSRDVRRMRGIDTQDGPKQRRSINRRGIKRR